jgi:hypothetical protein
MNDKRATPDSPAGKGRRKRAAPTIDLTATEVPPVTSEADPPPPAVAGPVLEAAVLVGSAVVSSGCVWL